MTDWWHIAFWVVGVVTGFIFCLIYTAWEDERIDDNDDD